MPKSTEIAKKMEASIPEFEKAIFNSELLAAQVANSLLLGRVFSGDTKDINGKELSPYSEAYAKKRKAAGRQTAKKDLIFTGALFESIQVGTKNNRPAMGFLTERSEKIGKYQEEQNGDVIFQLSTEEIDVVKTEVKDFVINEIRNIIKGWS